LELTAFPSKLATHLNKHLNNMVDRVQAVGGFHDIWACDAAGGHLNLYEDHLKTFWNHPNYCHLNGLPYVATFSENGLTNTAWLIWKASLPQNIYFCPDFDGTQGTVVKYSTCASATYSDDWAAGAEQV
jgi:hypothetical protein